jgi:hypothetical protein
VPHGLALVERLKDRPFAWIGVDSDAPDDPELRALPFERKLEPVRLHVRRELAELGVTWRNAIDGGTDGPWSTRWNVRAWPTVFVLDASRRIRYRGADFEKIEATVEACLAELDAARGR